MSPESDWNVWRPQEFQYHTTVMYMSLLVKSTSWCWSVLTQKCGCSHKILPQVCCHGHTLFFQQAELEWRFCDQSTHSDEGRVVSFDGVSFHQGYDLIWFDSSNLSAVELISSVADPPLPSSAVLLFTYGYSPLSSTIL